MLNLRVVDQYLQTALEICSETGTASLNLTTGERRLCLLWAHWMHDREVAGLIPELGYSTESGLKVFRHVLAEVREASAMIDIQARIVYYREAGKTTKM